MNALQKIDQMVDALDACGKKTAPIVVNVGACYLLRVGRKSGDFGYSDGLVYRGHALKLRKSITRENAVEFPLRAITRFAVALRPRKTKKAAA
jgi:hypothetical protein